MQARRGPKCERDHTGVLQHDGNDREPRLVPTGGRVEPPVRDRDRGRDGVGEKVDAVVLRPQRRIEVHPAVTEYLRRKQVPTKRRVGSREWLNEVAQEHHDARSHRAAEQHALLGRAPLGFARARPDALADGAPADPAVNAPRERRRDDALVDADRWERDGQPRGVAAEHAVEEDEHRDDERRAETCAAAEENRGQVAWQDEPEEHGCSQSGHGGNHGATTER